VCVCVCVCVAMQYARAVPDQGPRRAPYRRATAGPPMDPGEPVVDATRGL